MTDGGKRVVFLAESHAGPAPWYHLAYAAITDDAPVFLMNHWITTDPVPLDTLNGIK